MFDYEIRYLKPDGALALQFQVNCVDDSHARRVAMRMFKDEFSQFEIWQGSFCVDRGGHFPRLAEGM